MTKEELRAIVTKYFDGDNHTWPAFMSYGGGDTEVRYDYDSSKLCYSLIRHFKPTKCLEFGTSFGHSTIFITDALLKNEQPFEFVALEMEQGIYDAAKRNLTIQHRRLIPTLIHGLIEDHLDEIPQELDFVFIDTNHDRESTEWYVKHIIPRVKKGGLVAIHDFAVEEIDGKLVGKGGTGGFALPETEVLVEHIQKGDLGLEKLYWNYNNPLFDGENPRWEASFWLKK